MNYLSYVGDSDWGSFVDMANRDLNNYIPNRTYEQIFIK